MLLMKKYLQLLWKWWFENDLWLFLTVIAFGAYSTLFFFENSTIGDLLLRGICLCVAFLPMLLFVAFRQNDRVRQYFRWLWWGIMIIYPILMGILPLKLSHFLDLPMENAINTGTDNLIIPFLAIALILTEIGILGFQYLEKRRDAALWLPKLGLDHAVFFLVFALAIAGGIYLDFTFETVNSNNGFGRISFNWSNALQVFLFLLPFVGFYLINRHWLVPQVLRKKGWLYYGFGIVGMSLLCYPILGWMIQGLPIVESTGIIEEWEVITFQRINKVMATGAMPATVMILSLPFILASDWVKQNRTLLEMEKQQTETELNLLKQQINPHFFFNTLNNLYALSITKDERTPEVVLQLSELMRYVIYKGQSKQVALKEEIAYLEDYVQLQKIRIHQKLDFHFEKEIEDPKLQIPPLLFIILVENAFKHGIEPAANAAYLQLKLKASKEGLIFECINSVEEDEVLHSGIGHKNLRRRLELLFPNRHQLQLQMKDNQYHAILSLKL